VLDAFLSTWSKARETFGTGTPQSGERFDQSASLRQMQSTVETAAPGSKWTGSAANAYGAVNTDHAKVFAQLAVLDQRLGAHVTESAQVVANGRQTLDGIKKWVLDAAAQVPPGKNRDRDLVPIVREGLSRISNVVSTSNTELSSIAGKIRGLGTEWDKLSTDQKFGGGPKEGTGDTQNIVGDEEQKKKDEEEQRKRAIDEATTAGRQDGNSLADGQLTPEESQRLKDSTSLAPDQKAALNDGNLVIPPERMAYLNGLSHSLDGKSPAEIKSILSKLPPSEAQSVSNGLQLVGSDKVHTDGAGTSVKPGEHGYVPLNGGKDNLPHSIQKVFDAPLLNSPSGEVIHNPDGSITQVPPDYNKPYKYLDEYRDIAAIADYGDPSLQRGSALNDGLLAESRELLEHYQSDRWPNYDDSWGHKNLDPTLQQLISSASDDPVAVHDAIAGADGHSPNNDFIRDLYRHDWADDGTAMGSLFPDVADQSERAGQTMHAFDTYAGEHYQDLLNMSGNQSLGEVNPHITQALAAANVPYLDDMAGHNLDGSNGFGEIDHGANANTMRGLFAVIDSNDDASKVLNANAAKVWQDFVGGYSEDLAATGIPDGDMLKAAGKLQGAMDMGEYIHQLDSGKDSFDASTAAWEKKGQWYDLIHDVVGEAPRMSQAVDVYDTIPGDPLRQLFVGEAPVPGTPTPMPLHDMDELTNTVASYLVEQKAGDLSILRDALTDGHLDTSKPGVSAHIDDYLSSAGGRNELPYVKWSDAYMKAIYVSPGEFDPLMPHK
jgi:hypothetical protein